MYKYFFVKLGSPKKDYPGATYHINPAVFVYVIRIFIIIY